MTQKSLLPALIALIASIVLPGSSLAADVRAELDAVAAHGSAPGLRVTLNQGLDSKVRIGDDVTYHFHADRAAHLTALYVDAHGVASVVFPAEARVPAGGSVSFPPDGLALSVGPPVGRATIYVIATAEPITRASLGLPADEDVITLDSKRAHEVAVRIRAHVTGLSAAAVSVARLEHRVIGREDTEYTVGDVVAYMGPTRAIERPKLDLHVNFAFDSTDLTDDGRKNLDIVGKALSRSELSEDRFVLAGHTDDLGEPAYNDDLSLRRAKMARDYLHDAWQVDPQRIEIRGYGEQAPLEPTASDEARALNRRVELELIQ